MNEILYFETREELLDHYDVKNLKNVISDNNDSRKGKTTMIKISIEFDCSFSS